jgi:hypothetical protein
MARELDGGKCFGMTAELDIYRAANILVKEYGAEQAPLMAAKRADARCSSLVMSTGTERGKPCCDRCKRSRGRSAARMSG